MMSNNMDPDVRRQAAKFFERNPEFATLGNSDAHDIGIVGACYTEFDAEIRTSADLVAAIRIRVGRPCERVAKSA